jgi:hypothetical protein
MEKSEEEDREVAKAVSALEQSGDKGDVDPEVVTWMKKSMERFVREHTSERQLYFPSEWDKVIDSHQAAVPSVTTEDGDIATPLPTPHAAPDNV